MAIEPRLDDSVAEVPKLIADFCRAVEVASELDYFEFAEAQFGEQGIFGKAVWPMAHHSGLELVSTIATGVGRRLPESDDLMRCRRKWKDILSRAGDNARVVAEWDFENKTIDHFRRLVFMGGPDNPDDFEHELAGLDVHKLFTMGADVVWPDVRLDERFDANIVPVRRFVIETLLPPVIEERAWTMVDGERIGWDPADRVQEWTSEWLPESFWWRHLPDHIAVPTNDVC